MLLSKAPPHYGNKYPLIMMNNWFFSLSLTSLISQDDALSYSLPIVDSVSDLSIHQLGLLTRSTPRSSCGGYYQSYDVVFICRLIWVIHLVSLPNIQGMFTNVTGLDQINQSSEDWVHTFSSTTPRLGVESTPDKCVRLYIVPSTIKPGLMPHLSHLIHTKCTSTTGWSFTTPWVKTDP